MVTKATALRTWPRSSFVGFDQLWNELDQYLSNGVDVQAFPRHNLVKKSETEYTIELALAGYGKDELSIEVKDNTLVVRGEASTDDRDYVHKGITTKSFVRTFNLHNNVKASGADYSDGILVISLKVEVPEEEKPTFLSIGKSVKKKAAKLLTE